MTLDSYFIGSGLDPYQTVIIVSVAEDVKMLNIL